MIGTGGHLHPGGLNVDRREHGLQGATRARRRAAAHGGTLLLRRRRAVRRDDVLFSEDFQMEVTHPTWRAPIHKGDRIRITGIYENKDHAWYTAMTHEGIYIDEQQPPKGRCKPYLVGDVEEQRDGHEARQEEGQVVDLQARQARPQGHAREDRRSTVGIDPTEGVPNRPWGNHAGPALRHHRAARPCDRPEVAAPARPRRPTT